jgi:AAA15 family ATPase/GTPase
MLIEFEVGNFLSFNKPVRLSMVAANADKELLESNTFDIDNCRLLRSAVIYGANASGKSNLLDAMRFMQWFVMNSSKETQAQDEIDVIPFKLDYASESAPSRFEAIFLIDGIRYRYGFEANRKHVTDEWLFCSVKTKEDVLFLRTCDEIDVRDGFKEGSGLENKTRDNALFLSVAAQFNGEISKLILKWFAGFRALFGLFDQRYENYTALQMQSSNMRPLLLSLIQEADLGIEDLTVAEAPKEPTTTKDFVYNDLEQVFPPKLFLISSLHKKYRDGVPDGIVTMNFASEESEGTKKFFRIAGPILDCLQNGYIVCIDELDAKLHPNLTRAVVKLFNSSANTKNAQLIFTTHDTNLLQYGDLRRDQIWFTEKDQFSVTDLYSLAEFKTEGGASIRKDEAYEKNYIKGKYGAVPFLGDFGSFLKRAQNG